MVVESAGQLSFFQVSGNVLVGHLLEACLKKLIFLSLMSVTSRYVDWIGWINLIITPSSASSSGCLLSILLDTILVSAQSIDSSVGGWSHVGGVHLVHW